MSLHAAVSGARMPPHKCRTGLGFRVPFALNMVDRKSPGVALVSRSCHSRGGDVTSAKSYHDLKAMTEAELIQWHDDLAPRTSLTAPYILEEIARREQARQTDVMLVLTRRITWMTIVITVATLVNLLLTLVLLLRPIQMP